jgi:cephalosporin hydroxylase
MMSRMSSPADQYHCWYYDTKVWLKTTFLGIPSMKSVSDMWNYQEILYEHKPSLVLELGTGNGGSTLYFAAILQIVSARSRILSVDIHQSALDERVRRHPGIELLECDSLSPLVASRFAELRREYPGKAFCIADCGHHKEHVLAELMLLRSLTLPGDYVVVEDSNINGHPVFSDYDHGPGPYEALEEYLARFPQDYVPDRERENKFGFTFAPKGFLIRR